LFTVMHTANGAGSTKRLTFKVKISYCLESWYYVAAGTPIAFIQCWDFGTHTNTQEVWRLSDHFL